MAGREGHSQLGLGEPIQDVVDDLAGAVDAADLTLADASPMTDNRYKVALASNLVKRAISRLLGIGPAHWRNGPLGA